MAFRFSHAEFRRRLLDPGCKSIVLPGLVAVVCVCLFSGQYSAHHRGLSPYFAASSQFEDAVFARLDEEDRRFEKQQENRAQRKIIQVISRYQGGLSSKQHEEISTLIVKESKRYGYDPLFIAAMIATESSFHSLARSRRGALGLMQLRPATAHALSREVSVKWEGAPTLFNPRSNIVLGAYYFNKLVRRFGDLQLALEAYNHGPSKLNEILKKGYRPTDYSKKVIDRYEQFRSLPA